MLDIDKYRLSRTDKRSFDSIADSSVIIGFRNILVHGYDIVTDELVWDIVSENVPKLMARCEELLDESE